MLTPVQQRTLDTLRRAEPEVSFDQELVEELLVDASTALDELGARLDGQQLIVTKHGIGTVLACEAHHLEPDDFSWSPARAKGLVAHKAIQLLLNWRGEPAPGDVVDEALARLADEERSIGDYVAGLLEGEAADLRSQSVDLVTKFIECFPPLDRRWHPVTEAAAHHPVDGPIVLRARVDLVIGKPHGTEARKVIIDLKSGRVVDRHRQDLRFYALVETLCRGVPPRLLASFALDAGRPVVEVVTPALLRSTLRRTLDAVARMVELRVEGREPRRSSGAMCRWCRLLPDCPTGQAGTADDCERLGDLAIT
ncbi:MAG: PD-(D/E)XK nuclease family protein [Ilumatobacteraceae bacterium]